MKLPVLALLTLLLASASSAEAEEPAPDPAPAASSRYSLPWALRPAGVGNVLRSDTVVAATTDPSGQNGTAVVSLLLASHKLTPDLGAFLRFGYLSASPASGTGGSAFLNAIVGAAWSTKLNSDLRFAASLGLGLPVGSGGGNTPDPSTAAALKTGMLARSAMDNAMFAVNDLAILPGLDLAFVRGNLTIQAEATVAMLLRVRGDAMQADTEKLNFMSGLHLGLFLTEWVSLGTELRYQGWLQSPKAIQTKPSQLEQLSVAIGPRFHLQLADGLWLRPGLSWARGLNHNMVAQSANVVQLDLPFSY